MRKYLAAATALTLCLAAPAHAQEATSSSGRWSHESLLELTWDHAEDDTDTVAATFEFAGAYRFAERWTVEGGVVFEPVGEATGDTFFESEGAYVDSLFVHYSADTFSIFGGKFGPAFGSAAAEAPGLYGAEVGEAYELAEQTGFGGDVNLAALLPSLPGDHILSAAVFMADRSFLGDSIGERRGQLRLADGGLGNTDSPSSLAVSLDGELPSGMGYTFGARKLAASALDETDELALVAGLRVPLTVSSTVNGQAFAEIFTADDADGVNGARRTSYTASASLARDVWHGAVVASGVHDNATAGGQDVDYVELSLGRDLADGLVLDAGIRSQRLDGQTDALIGLRLSWEIS